jgi:putative FmdB family regulatory protein
MPFYDYICLKCGTEEEHLRSIEERHNAPSCRCGANMKLLVSSPAFKIDSTFSERLNSNYKKHKDRVKAGLTKPNSIDKKKGSIG